MEALPNAAFRVKVETLTGPDGQAHMVLATVSGKIRLNFIRILPGDRVKWSYRPMICHAGGSSIVINTSRRGPDTGRDRKDDESASIRQAHLR